MIDVADDGTFGYDPQHLELFRVAVDQALKKGGSLILRQFLSIKTESLGVNGEKFWMPLKKLYGFLLGNGQWSTLSVSVMEESYSCDAKTRFPLEKEKSVIYCEYQPGAENSGDITGGTKGD